jgi:hypothetical protein
VEQMVLTLEKKGWSHVIIHFIESDSEGLYLVPITGNLLTKILRFYDIYNVEFYEHYEGREDEPDVMELPEWLMNFCGLEAFEIEAVSWELITERETLNWFL